MKKTTKKVSEAKAPAAKKLDAPAKKTVAPAKKTATSSPAKKKSAGSKQPPATIIFAKIDIGFGNHLYIRGEGPGLSWDHGVAMDCVGTGLWTITIDNAALPVAFKLLVNDLSWSTGADYIAEPGQSFSVDPSF